jgi:O-antigen/teichoic acid export membrane protein
VRAAHGSVWALAGHAATLLATLAVTPALIASLGATGYGALALINTLVGYGSLSDLGIGLAATRYCSMAHARGNGEEEARLVWTAMLISALPLLLCGVLLAASAPWLVHHVFRIPDSLRTEASIALAMGGIVLVARGLAGVVRAPLFARLRLDLTVLTTAGTMVAQALLIIVALAAGAGLVQVVAVMAFANVGALILSLFFAGRLLPQLRQLRMHRDLGRPLFALGAAVCAAGALELLLFQTERLFLARFTTVTGLAYYAVAAALAQTLQIPAGAFSQAFFPVFSQLQTGMDFSRLERFYVRAMRLVVFALVPAAVLLAFVAEPFMRLWVGSEFAANAAQPFYVLCAGWLLYAVGHTPGTMLNALGRTGLLARFYLVMAVPFLAGAALATMHFGVTGAAAWWSGGAAIRSAALFVLVQRSHRFTYHELTHGGGAWLLAVAGCLLVPLLVVRVYLSAGLPLSVAAGGLSVVGYGALTWRRTLHSEERGWFSDRAASLKSAARMRFLSGSGVQ